MEGVALGKPLLSFSLERVVVGIPIGVNTRDRAIKLRKERPPRLSIGSSCPRSKDGRVGLANGRQLVTYTPEVPSLNDKIGAKLMLDVEVELLSVTGPEVVVYRVELSWKDKRVLRVRKRVFTAGKRIAKTGWG